MDGQCNRVDGPGVTTDIIVGNRVSYKLVISLNPEKDSNTPDGGTQQKSHPFSFFFIKDVVDL